MKALHIKKFAHEPLLELSEIDELKAEPSQVIVSIKAIGMNQADLLQCRGHYPAPPGFPADIPGIEFAGIIKEIGSAVHNLEVGQRVFGLTGGGAYSEVLAVHHQCVSEIPDDFDFIQAAAMPEVGITAYDALISQMKLSPGESVLISAIGSGVGLAALQIAKTLGCTVIGTSRSQNKLDRAKVLGLDFGLIVQDGKFSSQVKEIIANGVDVICELVGGDYLIEDIDCAALEGRIILIGLLGGRTANIDLGKVLSKRLLIKGTTLRARPLEQKIMANKILEKNIVPLLKNKKLKPVIDKTFKLSEATEAFEYLAAGENFGKIVVSV